MQAIPKRPRLVTAIDLLRQADLLLGPLQKLRRRELLGRLRRGVIKLAYHTDTVGVDIQPQLDNGGFDNRDWLPSVLGVGETAMVRFHWLSAVAHPRSLANTHVIFSIAMKRASPSDVPQLVTMMDEFHAEFGYPLNHQHATEAFATLLADDRLGCVWFIQADGQDVGYLVLTLCHSMEYGGLTAFVDDLFVRLPFRRLGLATAALTEVRAFCVQRGVRAIHVETGRDN